MVVPARDFLLDIIQLVLRKSTQTGSLDTFKQAVSEFVQSVMESDP